MYAVFRWEAEATWPLTHRGFVFLAQAFHEVGGALFPEEWTRDEPSSSSRLWLSPPDPELRPLGAAAWLRRQSAPMPLLLPKLGLFRSKPAMMLPAPAEVEAWEAEQALLDEKAREEFERLQSDHLALVHRRNVVARWIADAAINDDVETFARPVGGRGDPDKVKGSEVWAVDPPVWKSVLRRCRLPMLTENGVTECYLFLGRDSLDQAMKPLLERSKKRKMTPIEEADQQLLLKMHEARLADLPLSIPRAAQMFASEAWGNAAFDSKAKRLERHYVRRFGKGPVKNEG